MALRTLMAYRAYRALSPTESRVLKKIPVIFLSRSDKKNRSNRDNKKI